MKTDHFDNELDALEAAKPRLKTGNPSSQALDASAMSESSSGNSLDSVTTLDTLAGGSSRDSATLKTLSNITMGDEEGLARSKSMTAAALKSSRERLQDIRQSFERTEQELYSMLRTTQVASLNDVRRAFASNARGIIKRLAAWQAKHAPAAVTFDKIKASEPEWWRSGCYAVPGGRVVVRDGEWGSIISCALRWVLYSLSLSCTTKSSHRQFFGLWVRIVEHASWPPWFCSRGIGCRT